MNFNVHVNIVILLIIIPKLVKLFRDANANFSQERIVDSPARRPVKGRASSPVDVPRAATQILVSVSTVEYVKMVILVAGSGSVQHARQVRGCW